MEGGDSGGRAGQSFDEVLKKVKNIVEENDRLRRQVNDLQMRATSYETDSVSCGRMMDEAVKAFNDVLTTSRAPQSRRSQRATD